MHHNRDTKLDKNGKPFPCTVMRRLVAEGALREHPSTTYDLEL